MSITSAWFRLAKIEGHNHLQRIRKLELYFSRSGTVVKSQHDKKKIILVLLENWEVLASDRNKRGMGYDFDCAFHSELKKCFFGRASKILYLHYTLFFLKALATFNQAWLVEST